MPINDISEDPQQYSFGFVRNGVGFQVVIDPGVPYAEVDADVAIQEIVDLLDGWADNPVTAYKALYHNFSVTPTP